MKIHRKIGGQLSKIILFFVVFTILLAGVTKVYAHEIDGTGSNAPTKYADISPNTKKLEKTGDGNCAWKSGALINCHSAVSGSGSDYFYDPWLSSEAGHPVLRPQPDKNPDEVGYVHVYDTHAGAVSISKDQKDGSNGVKEIKVTGNELTINHKSGATSNFSGYYNEDDTCVFNGGAPPPKPGEKCKAAYEGVEFNPSPEQKRNLENQGAQIELSKTASCNKQAGTLSFFICPLLGFINHQISNLIGGQGAGSIVNGYGSEGGTDPGKPKGLFISFLQVDFQAANVSAILDEFKNLANALFIVIFLIIIFSTTASIGLDNYTIKKMLPRLVAAVIMVQFTYVITFGLIDVFNILGAGVAGIINTAGNNAAAKIDTQNIATSIGDHLGSNVGKAIGGGALDSIGVFLVIILALVALVSLIISIAALFFRQFGIILLIIIAPLAFVAWVLPNTEKYFKTWWTNFLKLLMMYPLITGLLALALLFAELGSSIFPANSELSAIIAAMFPLIALILIPKTFKWGGQMMTATSGAVGGYLSGKAKGVATEAYKKSSKEGTIAKAKGSAYFGAGRAISKVPGFGTIGGSMAKKGAGFRGAQVKASKEFFSSFTDDDLKKYIESASGKKREAAQKEASARYGKYLTEYASAYRDNRMPAIEFNQKQADNLHEHIYKGPANVAGDLEAIRQRVGQSQGGPPSNPSNPGGQPPPQPQPQPPRQRQQGGPGAGGVVL